MCSRGWGYRCPSAKGTRCTCSCGGACHGKARGMAKAEFQEKTRDNALFYLENQHQEAHSGLKEPVLASTGSN